MFPTKAGAPQWNRRETLSGAEHIRRRADFLRIYQDGARLQGRFMTIFLLPTGLPVARLGIAATRKVGTSVKRNHAKRLIRELFRRNKPAAGTDVVVIPRATLIDASFPNLEADYRRTLVRRQTARTGV